MMIVKKFGGLLFIFLLSLQLSGCASMHHHRYCAPGRDRPPDFNIDVSKIPNAVPKVEPRSKYGNPRTYVACGRRYYVMKSAEGYDEKGIASWYGMKFYKFRTSSGEPYDLAAMTAASKTLPLPTYVRVTNLQNGRTVVVKVNDRGPFAENRIIDLSYVAAVKLGVYAHGTALVEVKAIDPRHYTECSDAPAPSNYVAPTAAHGKPELYLQIGAFGEAGNANQLLYRAKHYTSYPVVIKSADKNGHTIYRVEIGPLPNVESFDALAQQLESAGLGKPIAAVQ